MPFTVAALAATGVAWKPTSAERATAVARVDRSVGLNGVGQQRGLRVLARHLDRPVERADNAAGHGGRQAKRGAEGDDRLADDQRTERPRPQNLAARRPPH